MRWTPLIDHIHEHWLNININNWVYTGMTWYNNSCLILIPILGVSASSDINPIPSFLLTVGFHCRDDSVPVYSMLCKVEHLGLGIGAHRLWLFVFFSILKFLPISSPMAQSLVSDRAIPSLYINIWLRGFFFLFFFAIWLKFRCKELQRVRSLFPSLLGLPVETKTWLILIWLVLVNVKWKHIEYTRSKATCRWWSRLIQICFFRFEISNCFVHMAFNKIRPQSLQLKTLDMTH